MMKKIINRVFLLFCLLLVYFQAHAQLNCASLFKSDKYWVFEQLEKNELLMKRIEEDGILFKDRQVFEQFMSLGLIQREVALALVPQISNSNMDSPRHLLNAFGTNPLNKQVYLVRLLFENLMSTVKDQAKHRYGQFGVLNVGIGALPYYLPNFHALKLALDRARLRIRSSYGGANKTLPIFMKSIKDLKEYVQSHPNEIQAVFWLLLKSENEEFNNSVVQKLNSAKRKYWQQKGQVTYGPSYGLSHGPSLGPPKREWYDYYNQIETDYIKFRPLNDRELVRLMEFAEMNEAHVPRLANTLLSLEDI